MNTENKNNVPDAFSLEEAFKRIKEIQALLQDGQLGFDESLLLYEEAETLIRQSQLHLTQAELRIQTLTAGSGDES
jgi:exodeoxyribonuclease VII small subunit